LKSQSIIYWDSACQLGFFRKTGIIALMMQTRPKAEKIIKILNSRGHTAYFAGGWVRDYVMGHAYPSEDIDIATSATPEQVQSIFTKTVPVGVNFGVVIVMMEGHPFEVSTFRKDIDYKDGRRPSAIALAAPKEDALRRDFTINGMFFDPKSESVIDYVGGKEDIEKKCIKTIGEPYLRFEEDRLRMIRAVRFAVRFGFTIDPKTKQGILAFSHVLYPAVAVERVWQEWKKMTDYPNVGEAVLLLDELKLLFPMFPLLQGIKKDALEKKAAHLNLFCKGCPAILYLLPLIPNPMLQKCLAFCETFKLSSKDKQWVEHYFKAEGLDKDPVAWAKFLADPKSDPVLDVISYNMEQRDHFLLGVEANKKELFPHILRIQNKNPLITSQDLMREGIPAGKIMGTLLEEAEKIAICNNLQDKGSVLDHLRSVPQWPK
jgi:poly(A) polymerase